MPQNLNISDPDIFEGTHESGIYGLWLSVVLLAVKSYLDFGSTYAENFLFDEENYFFDFVCEQLGYTPESIRQRLKARKRSKSNDGKQCSAQM